MLKHGIRWEIERCNASTDTERYSSYFGIHIFADWVRIKSQKLFQQEMASVPSTLSPKSVDVIPIEVSTT
jgi:hypothetical protein